MKISIAYHPDLSYPEKGFVDARKMEAYTETRIMAALKGVSVSAEDTLLYICFHVDVPVKTIVASMVILSCIQKKFPEYKPTAIFINTLPSPSLEIDIEFGNFRDIGKAFI